MPAPSPSRSIVITRSVESCAASAASSTPYGRLGAERGHHQRRADRVPAVGDHHREPFRVGAVADDLGRVAQQRAERDERRHGFHRRQEQHRHEHDLGRADQPRAEREADPPDQRVTHDQRRRRAPVAARLGGHRDRDGHEQRGGGHLHAALARREPARHRGAAPLQQRLGHRGRGADGALERDHHLQGVSAAAGSPWAGSRMHREGAELVESRAGAKRVRALTLCRWNTARP